MRRKIVVLLHEADDRAEGEPYLIWAVREAWEREGSEVAIVRGTSRFEPADVAVAHIDLTVVPEDYARFLSRYPRALNLSARDLSKRAVSRNLVSSGNAWDGPVIVKTDRNSGGFMDRDLLERPPAGNAAIRWVRRTFDRLTRRRLPRGEAAWRRARCLWSGRYPVFDSLRSVPPAVFENPALVVERFLPEREGDFYVLRTYTFLGDRFTSGRALSRISVVKSWTAVSGGEAPLHEGVLAERARLGLDFGKIDYVVRDGAAIVLDASRTPTVSARMRPERRRRIGEDLAAGLESLLR